MDLHTFQPTFLIQIEGRALSTDLTGEITSFVFEDNEEELDMLELSVSDRHLRFVDDPLFQEGNEIVARFGYVNDLSPRKKAVIKDIDYDFPEDGAPSIRLKAYDKGFQLAGKENQKVWKKPAPGILFSEIAEEIAAAHGLTPVVTPTVGRHLRVVQSNVSDAQFLKDLAAKARDRDGDGVTGYTFFVEDEGLHFHPRRLETEPAIFLEYFTDRRSLLRSFRPSTQSQGAKGAGTQTKATGVDPRRKAAVEHTADNETTAERPLLGPAHLSGGRQHGRGDLQGAGVRPDHAELRALRGLSRGTAPGAGSGCGRGDVRRSRAAPGGGGGGDRRPTCTSRQTEHRDQGGGREVFRRLLLPRGAPRPRRGRLSLRAAATPERPGPRRRRPVDGDPGQAQRAGSTVDPSGGAA